MSLTESSLSNLMRVIAATRERLVGEIVPVRAEQSSTKDDNEEVHGAANAIDLDMSTRSYTKSSNPVWLKLIFDQVQCVKEVMWYEGNLPLSLTAKWTWTCSQDNCFKCEGHNCNEMVYLDVNIEGTIPDHNLPPNTDCRYGDVVRINDKNNHGYFSINEIGITGKQGERK